MTLCKIDDCERPRRTRDMCKYHYQRMMKGDPALLALNPDVVLRECQEDGCDQPVVSHGWCNKHWKRVNRHGDPQICLLPEKDQGPWRLEPNSGYVRAARPSHPNAAKDEQIAQHTFVMSEYLGRPIAPNETVHHKNGIRSDNRLENLELWASKHPAGQRVIDLVEFAKQIQRQYAEFW